MLPPTVHTFTAPAAWASYLVNGDHSGLTASEKEEADAAVAQQVEALGSCHVVDCSEPEFRSRPGDYGRLAGDYCTYTHLA